MKADPTLSALLHEEMRRWRIAEDADAKGVTLADFLTARLAAAGVRVGTPDALDAAYRERNAVVAALIHTNDWPAWYVAAPDAEGWFIVYAESDEGQLSWHVGPQDIDLFNGWMSAGARAGWDGWDRHTTEEKYQRVAALRVGAPDAGLRKAVTTFLHRWDDPERYHALPAVDALRAALAAPRAEPERGWRRALHGSDERNERACVESESDAGWCESHGRRCWTAPRAEAAPTLLPPANPDLIEVGAWGSYRPLKEADPAEYARLDALRRKAAPPPLDVERLALAIERAVDAIPRHAWHDQAAAIASEYARLSEAPTPEAE